MAVVALHNAVQRCRPPASRIVHSDRDSRFGSTAFRRELRPTDWPGQWARSARRRTKPQWNPPFALLQRKVLDRRRSATPDQLPPAIVTWIERSYHRRRRQRRLGRLPPIEYETIDTIPRIALPP